MCKYCEYGSDECEIFQDWKDNGFYLEVCTGQWDDYDDGWIYERVRNINYCPYCGRKLIDNYQSQDESPNKCGD